MGRPLKLEDQIGFTTTPFALNIRELEPFHVWLACSIYGKYDLDINFTGNCLTRCSLRSRRIQGTQVLINGISVSTLWMLTDLNSKAKRTKGDTSVYETSKVLQFLTGCPDTWDNQKYYSHLLRWLTFISPLLTRLWITQGHRFESYVRTEVKMLAATSSVESSQRASLRKTAQV